MFLSTLSNDTQVCFSHAHSLCPRTINVDFVIVRIIVPEYAHSLDNCLLEIKQCLLRLMVCIGQLELIKNKNK